MHKFFLSNLLLLLFLVGAASGLSLSSVAWHGLRAGQHDLAQLYQASGTAARASAYRHASVRISQSRSTLIGLSLLASALFCATAWFTYRQALQARKNTRRLGRDHALFKNLFNASSDGIFLLHQQRIIDYNHAALDLFAGPGARELPHTDLCLVQPPCQPDGSASRPAWRAQLERSMAAPATCRFEWNFICWEGKPFTAEVTVNAARVGDDSIVQLIVRDISERKLAENAMRLANQAFESSLEGIAITDADRKLLTVNRAFTTITGYSRDEVIGKSPSLLSSGRHDQRFYQDMWAALNGQREWQGEIWNIRKNGEVYPQWLNISQVRDAHGRVTNYIGVFSDISELKAAHARNLHAVYHDQLTSLPNSVLLADRLHQLSGQAHPGDQLALMYMDVDRLKVVNDSMGREAGDQLLQLVAARLLGSIRATDTLARLNGDEFALLLSTIDDVDDASAAARHILRSFDAPFELLGQLIHVSLSIGISVYPTDGTVCETLLQHAAMAMYRAKQRGGVAYELYDRELGAQAGQRLAIETGLRHALERHELEVFYQPQFECHSGKLIGFEALLRWRHPELGLIPPDSFLAIAEETGAIVPIGAWVLQSACAQAQAWRRQSRQHRLVAVNLSARQLRHPDFVQHVISALENSGLPANCLELEITESMMMHDLDACVDIMHRLAALGVEFSIDDFGTGYSSLSYLKKMPIKALKIDRSFIRDIVSDADGASIVGAIVAMSDTLGLRVVAEGIEDHAQLAHLQGYNAIIGQGYLLGRPATAQAAGELIDSLEPALALPG